MNRLAQSSQPVTRFGPTAAVACCCHGGTTAVPAAWFAGTPCAAMYHRAYAVAVARVSADERRRRALGHVAPGLN